LNATTKPGQSKRPAAGEAQHALAQPLHPEQQQRDAHHNAEGVAGDLRDEHGADHDRQRRARERRRARAGQGGARPPRECDGEHDRHRLEELERDRERGAGRGEDEGHAAEYAGRHLNAAPRGRGGADPRGAGLDLLRAQPPRRAAATARRRPAGAWR